MLKDDHLLLRGGPLLKGAHVLRVRGDQQEGLAAADNVVPHRAAPEVHVEVGVATSRAHQAIQQHLPTGITSE